jgi:hypothetical protein
VARECLSGIAHHVRGHYCPSAVEVLRLAVPSMPSDRLGMGSIALGFLLAPEFGLVLLLRGMSIREYLASRDAASGTVNYVMLVVLAIMPLPVARDGDIFNQL